MKKALLLLSLFIITLTTYGFEYNGINYTVVSSSKKTVKTKNGSYNKVTAKGTPGNDVYGDIVLPEKIPYNDEEYTLIGIGDCSFVQSGVKNVTLPPSIEYIESQAFYGSTLTSINLPDKLTDLGDGTNIWGILRNCSFLESVTFGKGFTYLYGNAFLGCPKIKDVYIYAVKPPTRDSAFGDDIFSSITHSKVNLHVLPQSVELYKNATEWKKFNIIGDLVEVIDAKSITLDPQDLVLKVGEKATITATVEPENATVEWSVSPEGIVSVENGEVEALKVGNAVITLTSGNVSATCNVEVQDDTQGGGSEDPNSGTRILFMEPGQQLDIRNYFDYTTEVQPLAVLMDYYEFESSDPEVVDGVSQDGGFEAKKYGMANLKVSYINKMEDTKTVNEFLVFVCPTVTVEQGNGILYSHHVLYNSTPRLSLNPGLGYKLVGVTHDGKEITETLAGNDGMYTPAEPITDNSTINLSLEETGNGPTTGATSIWSNSDIRIYVDGHHVKIVGVAPGTYITMTNLAGKQLYNDNKYHEIDVIDAGVYLITIDGQPNAFKIVIR